MNPYSGLPSRNQSLNRRPTALRSRRGFPYHALNVHFDNINILANIIQDSQVLLEGYNTQWGLSPPPVSTQPSAMDITPFFMENLVSSINSNLNRPTTAPVDVSGSDLFQTNLNIHRIDASFIHVYAPLEADASNQTELYDFEHFCTIPNPINSTCPITRESFLPTQNVLMIRSCHHIFNKNALMIWISTRNTCPLCRCVIRNTPVTTT